MKHLIVIVIILSIGLVAPNPLKSYSVALVNELQVYLYDPVLFWNGVLLQAAANDYDRNVTAVPDQAGPTTTSRAFAIVHGAMYDALTLYNSSYRPLNRPNSMQTSGLGMNTPAAFAAVMDAAVTTLVELYPKQKSIFQDARKFYFNYLKSLPGRVRDLNDGATVGRTIANYMLTVRSNDNSGLQRTYTAVNQSGYHQVDPTHPEQGYLSPNWGRVKPFVLRQSSQFRASDRVGESPSSRAAFLNSSEYLIDFDEVKRLGAISSSERTNDQTEIGIFWGYDGAPKLGVPPRLYNQVVRTIAIQEGNDLGQNALLFAMVNYAMADAGIAAWETKYYYNVWRPIVGIRRTSTASGGDPNWTPLGAPADGNGNNFTPGFPSYVSGHSTFGSATFQVLRLFYASDSISFRFQSDEYNGRTVDSITRSVRPARTRIYRNFNQAETENFLSRIYLGVHWRFDQEEGKIMGRKVGSFVYNSMT